MVVVGVEPAEHQRVVAELELVQPVGDVALDHLPFPAGLFGAALADLDHRAQRLGPIARRVQALVGMVDVGLLGSQFGMGRQRHVTLGTYLRTFCGIGKRGIEQPTPGRLPSGVEQEREHERLVLPGVVPARRAAVAGTHLGLEQERSRTVDALGDVAEAGHPLGRLPVPDPRVVEAARGQHRRERGGRDVLVPACRPP